MSSSEATGGEIVSFSPSESTDAQTGDTQTGDAQTEDAQTRDALSILAAIESRTAAVTAQIRQALAVLMGRTTEMSTPDEPFQPGHPSENGSAVTVSDLERCATYWQGLVPSAAHTRIALVCLIASRYPLVYDRVPSIRQVLGLDDVDFQQAYQHTVGQPLATIFAPQAVQPLETMAALASNLVHGDDTTAVMWSDIDADLEWVPLRRGAILFLQGSASDSLYVLINGRLRVTVSDDGQTERVIDELGRGSIVGEMGVLTGEARSATVTVLRDAELVRLSAAAFDRLVERHPAVMRQMAATNIARLRRTTQSGSPKRHVETIALVPLTQNPDMADVARRIAAELARHGSTLHLTRNSRPQIGEPGGGMAAPALGQDEEDSGILEWLTDCETRYRFVLYEAEADSSTWTRRCIRQADHVLLVGSGTEDPATSAIDLASLGLQKGSLMPRLDLVLLHPDRSHSPSRTGRWLQRLPIQSHYHVAMDTPDDLRRLVQRLLGRGIGLVLGGGALRGFAHIGVLRALEEAHIPISVVAGASSGSWIAALTAMGWDSKTIYAIARKLFVTDKNLFDVTLPLVALLAGRRLTQLMATLFADRQIEDLWLTFFCVSTNLNRGKLMVHDRGSVAHYVRASSALPGILSPVLDHGDLLADGGVLNGLPVTLTSKLCDGGPVIAVDVSSQYELARAYRFGDNISAGELIASRLNPFARTKLSAPSVVSVLLRSLELGGLHEQGLEAQRASLFLNPPIVKFGAFDIKALRTFDDAALESIVNVGYEHAREKIAEWPARSSLVP